ncbi:MAG: dipeptidyl-peptidase 3 family protein [Bacteroidota bacterium]
MKRRHVLLSIVAAVGLLLPTACQQSAEEVTYEAKEGMNMEEKVAEFAEVELTADISHLSENQKQMLGHMFEAAYIMDDLFWKEAYGDKNKLLNGISDEATKAFVKINYGPWERLNNNEPFIKGIEAKPAGAQFYPEDMTKEEFKALDDDAKSSLYTLIRRDSEGNLKVVPYHQAFKAEVEKAATHLKEAAKLAENESFKKYLNLRAEALLTDEYLASDMAWMDVRNNNVDFVVGPIENYEDNLYGYKAAHESFILIKDMEWTKKLDKFAALLPELQKRLPVADEYKTEVPGSDSDMGVYEVVYYAGDCNAGSKTIAINLPNDERVHIEKGSRKLQLKNAMRYKFEKILLPISEVVIDPAQRKHVKFDAFFENTMFHEVAHGMGIKNTINGKGTVREALQEQYSALEEGKADIIGLQIVTQLAEMGELGEKELMDNYVTFMASIFRSIRFGAASSHGKANMVRFNYFNDKGAFTRNEDGTYTVNFDKMTETMKELGEKILTIQGDGNYEAAKKMVTDLGNIREQLQADLDRIANAGIPRDIRYNQGKEVIGL